MNVSDAMSQRSAVRAFLPDPIDGALLREILTLAGRAPSNGNLQPWQVFVVGGQPLSDLKAIVAQRHDAGEQDKAEYAVYPPSLWEPLRSRRKAAGAARYSALGYDEKDPLGLDDLLRRNQRFFDAPLALFFFLDRRCGPPQWCDLGMFMQSVMLLALERGLASCPQAYWASWPQTVGAFLNADPGLILVAGMALGYPDRTHPLARTRAERAALDDFARFIGVRISPARSLNGAD